MIRNYLVSVLRNFRKNRLTSFVNVAGLMISLSALVIISLFIRRELAYDKSHPGHERIFRVTESINSGSYIENSSSCPYPVATALQNDFPDYIETVVRWFDFQIPDKWLRLENNELYSESAIFYADSNAFEIFDFPLVVGSPDKVLSEPFNMVVSEELAKKWFGDKDPVGQSVFLAGGDELRCTITGVFKPGGPSHIQPRAVISMSTVNKLAPNLHKNWVWNPHWTYVKLKENVDPSTLESNLQGFVQKNFSEMWRDMITLDLQPISSIHLDSHLEFEMTHNSDRKYIYIFLSCAFFLIVVAIVNFVNLTTVSLWARVREVGVRKVAGATRGQLISQFIFEAVMLSVISFICGILLLAVVYPFISSALNLQIPFAELFDPLLLLILGIAVILTGIIAGIYPALLISRTNTAEIFKGGLRGNRRGQFFRKVLVIVQFGIALVLIVFTLMANRQFEFMQHHDNGYSTDNVLTMTMANTSLPGNFDAFRQELLKDPKIKSVSMMNEIIGINNNNHEFNFADIPEGEWQYLPALMVDEHFLRTLEIDILAGRDYDPALPAEDSTSIVINRALAEYLGYENPGDAIGQSFHSMSGNEVIVGVAENFNFKSLHHPVGPFVIDVESRNQGNYYYFAKHIVVKVTETSPAVLAHMEKVWKTFVDNAPFQYDLLNNHLSTLYEREATMNKVLSFFSFLAITIACLGLFALTWALTRLKAKEIAVRKTLGAELPHLIYIATREQMTMIALSILLSFPVAWLLINNWLSSFAFRTTQEAWSYIGAALIASAIAFLTIIFLAIRAARQDPAIVLKYE